MSQRAVTAATPPTLGSTGQGDWDAVPLASGSSVIEALRARGVPVTRDVLAAIAQVNGIRDFRRIAAGTSLWLPRRESISGDRAQVWREAYRGLTPDSFATVDSDRARGSVRGRAADGPRLAAPSPARGPRPQSVPTQDLTVDPLDVPAAERPPAPIIPSAPVLDPNAPVLDPAPVVAAPPGVLADASAVPAPTVPDARAALPDPSAIAANPDAVAADPLAVPAGPAAAVPDPSAAAVAAPAPASQLQQLTVGLATELRAGNRDNVLRIVYALMASPDWTNQDARRAYAAAVGSQNEWQLIADLRASGMSSRDILRASEYVWNDESTPFDGQVSPPIRAVLAAIGYRERGFMQLDAAVGTADASFEDALWEIVESIGVDAANAVIASRAGANPAGTVSNARFTHDPANPGIIGRLADMVYPHRRPAPLDGAIQAAPAGSNPLADMVNSEYARWKNVAGGFSGARRDRMLAILRMPPGTDRRSFEIASQATAATGEDFLKLFEGRTREQMTAITAAFNAGFGSEHGGSLDSRALSMLDGDQMLRYQALLLGTRSDPTAAARYIALTVRARARDSDGLRAALRLVGSTEAGTPTWQQVQDADARLDPTRANATPLDGILQRLGNDPMVHVVRRDNASPDEPAGIARRILGSRDPREIERLLKRTDGDLFNDQELAIMNQTAAQLTGGDPAANPSNLYRHIAELCGPNSEAALIVQRVGGPRVDAPLHDEHGRLSPAAQLFFALQRGDATAVSTLLSRTPFVALSGVERAYEQVVAHMSQAGVAPPGSTADIRAAVRGVLRGEERQRALQFLTGFDATRADAANQTGAQLAAAVSADLRSRCAWLLRQFDHEREPLEERLMQFEVTLAQVLTAVQQRRQASGQATELTDEEQVRLGEAVRRLVGQRRNFEVERDALARTIQDTTILVSTTVASIAVSVGTFGVGAAPSAALWTTVATRIAAVATVGTAAGLVTAPLQGGDNRYLTSGARGFAYGAFSGLGAASPQANAILARVIPGAGIVAGTARNGIVMATVMGGLSASSNIGVEFESTQEALRKVSGDALRGALFGLGFAGVMGFAQWLIRAGGGVPSVPAGHWEQLNENLRGYIGARDLRGMERAFANLSGGQLPPPGVVIELTDEARALLSQGINRHLATLAQAPASSVAAMTEQARWLTTLTLYANASGIQLQGEALQHAVALMQRMGVAEASARLTEAQARSLLQQTAERLRAGEQILRGPPPPVPTPGSVPVSGGPAAQRGVRLLHASSRAPVELRSWAQVNVHARNAGTRAMPLEAALHTRQELITVRNMLETQQGRASLAAMQRELGPIAARDLDALRRGYLSAIGRVDQQIAQTLRSEAAQLARASIPAGDIGPYYTRLARLHEMQVSLGAMRSQGMTREVFEAASHGVAESRRALDTALAARVRETFANPGADPRGMLGTVVQFRDTMRAQGFVEAAPETMRAFNEAIQRFQRAAAPRVA